MHLLDALEFCRQAAHPDRSGSPLRIYIASGFTPLHLATFLTAYTVPKAPTRPVSIQTGLFGDLSGTLETAASAAASAIAVFIEWPDLDPRLTVRQSPPSGGVNSQEILHTTSQSAARFRQRLEKLGTLGIPVAVAMPSLAPPAWGHEIDALASPLHLELEAIVNELARHCAASGLRVISRRTLDQRSPLHTRHDIKAELKSGFPYTLAHTEVLADLASRLLVPNEPKKAIVTDLDDTLWSGIVGEIGPEQVSWNLDEKSSLHGHYQQTLATLAAAGVLIGVATKNDSAIAETALARPDLVIPRAALFPVEANWSPKSESVGRMLKAWNIGAASVVFVDDSPMELAEVQQAFPAITCLNFPKDNPAAVLNLLDTLRNLCGRMRVSAEDLLRRESLQAGQQFLEEGGVTDKEQFLSSLNARIVFENGASDPRALELVNKTNQFNLHGGRYAPDEWKSRLARDGAFVWTVSYEDKFGALGKIAVLAGEREDGRTLLRDMVLSCRAFSRRVEFAALRFLLDSTGSEGIRFIYRPTDRNGPLREFLTGMLGPAATETPEGPILTRGEFAAAVPPLYHEISDKTNA